MKNFKNLTAAAVTLLLSSATAITLPATAQETKGFHTEGTRLLDANDNEFVMRGLNYSYSWQSDKSWVIKSTHDWGCNSIRINIGDGDGWPEYTNHDTLKWLIEECEKHNLIGVFAPHNETGKDSHDNLMKAAEYWVGMKDLVNAHTNTMLINITNEWMQSWDASHWSEGYVKAVTRMREAGIKNTIIVDVAGYGQGADVLNDDGGKWAQAIIDADPEHNLMFSIHMYHVSARTPEIVRKNIDYGLALNVPLLIGEFAFEHKAHLAYPEGGPVAWQEILDYTREKNVGYLVWSWSGNGQDAETCDMFDWYGNIMENGKCTIYGRNGIKMTSTECSIFNPDSGKGEAYSYPEGPFDFEPYEGPGDDLVVIDPTKPDADYWFNEYLPYTVGSWDNVFQIRAHTFRNANEWNSLRITLKDVNSAEIQIAYNHADTGEWTKIIDYENVSDNVYILPLGPAASNAKGPRRERRVGDDRSHDLPEDLLRHAKSDGIYLKGHGYTIDNVEFLDASGIPTGVENIEDNRESPIEIYDMTGTRVFEMQKGSMYIIRQGDNVRKAVR